MKFMYNDREVFKYVFSVERTVLATLLSNGSSVIDTDGYAYKESSHDKHEVEPSEYGSKLIIYVKRED